MENIRLTYKEHRDKEDSSKWSSLRLHQANGLGLEFGMAEQFATVAPDSSMAIEQKRRPSEKNVNKLAQICKNPNVRS